MKQRKRHKAVWYQEIDLIILLQKKKKPTAGVSVESQQQHIIIPISELKFEKELASGGQGVVRLAHWKEKQVAVKRLLKNASEQLKDYLNEISIMASNKSADVVRYFLGT